MFLDRLGDPVALGLLLENMSKSSVVGRSPKGKVEEEPNLCSAARQDEVCHDLESQGSDGDEVERRLWLARIKDGSEHIGCMRHDERVAIFCSADCDVGGCGW